MATATLYKIVLLVIAVMAFYGYKTPEGQRNPSKNGLVASWMTLFVLMTVLSLREWGWAGIVLPTVATFLGVVLNFVFTDWGLRLVEWATERRSLMADIYMKLDQDEKYVLIWPLTSRAKSAVVSANSYQLNTNVMGNHRKRGSYIIWRKDLAAAQKYLKDKMLVAAHHKNMTVALEETTKGAS